MKKLIILLIFLLILPIVNAEFSPESASNFISGQTTADVVEKSFQVLSLSFYDPTIADKIATQIQSIGTNCWPTSCKVKDTSLALMALHKRGESIDTNWLISQQAASTSGKWYLQIDTSATGTCKVSYGDEETSISVDNGQLATSSCTIKSTKLDINSCIKPNLLSQPGREITIDCDNLGSTPTISLLNQDGNSYYIVDKAIKTQKLVININNGYFGTVEDTLFANWFLSDINFKINSKIWLKKNYDESNVLHISLMYLITSDEAYLASLIDLQDQTTGSFGDTYATAIATLALARSGKYNSALESARTFLGDRQFSDGSIENNLLYTTITLYGYSITKPSEGVSEFPIPSEETPSLEPSEICNYDGICDVSYGEHRDNCPEDCSCGDGVCDATESFVICPDDCEEEAGYEEGEEYVAEEKSSAIWWILIIFIIIAVLAFLYYTQFYKKGKKLFEFKKKPKIKPTYTPKALNKTPSRRISVPVYHPKKLARKSQIEKELEKSLEEARKLLKK